MTIAATESDTARYEEQGRYSRSGNQLTLVVKVGEIGYIVKVMRVRADSFLLSMIP
jgi:hypothetical protein